MADRLGVFGGTFDPPHLGHLILASEAHWQLQLNRVLWMLTAQPPHKQGRRISPVEDRLEMVRLALADEPGFELSRLDVDRAGPHYTLDMLRLLRAQHPRSNLILLIGGDSLGDLPRWLRPAEVVAACDGIGVMRRPGDEIDLSELEGSLPGLIEKTSFVEAPLLEISSHEIRERAANHQPFRYYVPAAVHDYILTHGLYQR